MLIGSTFQIYQHQKLNQTKSTVYPFFKSSDLFRFVYKHKYTLRLHYNAVLYNTDSIITRSPHGSQIFFQYTMCENVSRWSRYTHCKLWKSYSLCIS